MTEYSEQKHQNVSEIVQNLVDFNPDFQIKTGMQLGEECAAVDVSANLEAKLLSDLRPFRCNFAGCGRDYSNKSRLEIHLRTHTGDKPFSCEKCGRSFNEKGNLKIHYRIHTGEKPYKCSYQGCNKEFKAYGHLSDHLKRHFNIRPFKCEICNASFSRRNTLKTHIMTHTGEKPHKCSFPGCNKRFSEKGNMKTHLKTHNRNNKKKFPYSEIKENDEKIVFNFPANLGLRVEKDFMENSQVQKCYEYFYLGSKTTSSTTILPASPKQLKVEEENKDSIKKAGNPHFFPNQIVMEEETEFCATPKRQQNSDFFNKNENKSNTNNVFLESNNDYQKLSRNNNNNCNATCTNYNKNKNNLITKDNFSESLNNILQTNAKGNSALKGDSASLNPNFNFAKFYEAQKLSQENSPNSVDSASTNLMTASRAESPMPLNSNGNLDLKQSCFTNLNLIFNEDYLQKNRFRSNYAELFAEEEFGFNYKNTGFLGHNYNADFLSLDNFFE